MSRVIEVGDWIIGTVDSPHCSTKKGEFYRVTQLSDLGGGGYWARTKVGPTSSMYSRKMTQREIITYQLNPSIITKW